MRPITHLVICVLLATACGGSDSTEPPATRPPVATVEVGPANSAFVLGDSVQLTAVTRAGDGSELIGRTIVWTSSEPSTATVDDTGKVLSISPGDAVITATSENVDGSAAVSVLAPGAAIARPK